ncbi:MAG: ATP-binding protein [Caulobacteraceae bacterium]
MTFAAATRARMGRLLTGAWPRRSRGEAEAPFPAALIQIDDGRASLVSGHGAFAHFAAALGLGDVPPAILIESLAAADPAHARALEALAARGEPCAFETGPGERRILVEGRTTGALAWLRLSSSEGARSNLPQAGRLAALLDARDDPAWLVDPAGAPTWANRAWLTAVGATSVEDAAARGLTLDTGADRLAREAAAEGQERRGVRVVALGGGRRALFVRAIPLDDGGAGVDTLDVSAVRAAEAVLARHTAAHEATLRELGDAVAVFAADRRLAFHNPAFATLWSLEAAWLAERPTHGELLDRLRQRRLLPETIDYARFRADELARHRRLGASQEAIWRLASERTLRVTDQPRPDGGLTLIFSDITPELRLKSQFNQLIQVRQATLDKLTDAVAVFGADARLTLHNEAFARFWGIDVRRLDDRPAFDAVVELCLPRIHDLAFWRGLKGRIADPDPVARAPRAEEMTTADGRIVAFQSLPLPDGATLIGFADVTDTRRLEGALRDREAALDQAERLKREFVGSVSYELRTPLTTIVGYAELLERSADQLPAKFRGYIAAVRAAATDLARSIDNVLDMAEIDAGETALDIAEVEIADLLARTASRWAAESGAAGVAMEIDLDSETGPIRGDARRLGQALDHLAQNALRHTPRGGAVTFSARRARGEVRLMVRDTGGGIPFHVQAHIFDRFSGQDRGGPGLGLALVKAIVELHGGWVALESEPGAGATFTCHLPEAAAAPADRPELF